MPSQVQTQDTHVQAREMPTDGDDGVPTIQQPKSLLTPPPFAKHRKGTKLRNSLACELFALTFPSWRRHLGTAVSKPASVACGAAPSDVTHGLSHDLRMDPVSKASTARESGDVPRGVAQEFGKGLLQRRYRPSLKAAPAGTLRRLSSQTAKVEETCLICLESGLRCAHVRRHGSGLQRCGPWPVCMRCARTVAEVDRTCGQFRCPVCRRRLGPLRRALQEGADAFAWDDAGTTKDGLDAHEKSNRAGDMDCSPGGNVCVKRSVAGQDAESNACYKRRRRANDSPEVASVDVAKAEGRLPQNSSIMAKDSVTTSAEVDGESSPEIARASADAAKAVVGLRLFGDYAGRGMASINKRRAGVGRSDSPRLDPPLVPDFDFRLKEVSVVKKEVIKKETKSSAVEAGAVKEELIEKTPSSVKREAGAVKEELIEKTLCSVKPEAQRSRWKKNVIIDGTVKTEPEPDDATTQSVIPLRVIEQLMDDVMDLTFL